MSKLISKLMMMIAVISIIGTIGVPEFVERCNQRGQEAVVKAALNTFYRSTMHCFASLEGTFDSNGNPITEAQCWANEESGYASTCGIRLTHPNVKAAMYACICYGFQDGVVITGMTGPVFSHYYHIDDPDTHYWLTPDGSIVNSFEETQE